MIKKALESSYNRVSGVVRRSFARGLGFLWQAKGRWIQVLYLLGIIAFSAGLVNAAVQPVDQRYVIFPQKGFQSISETVINAFAILLGASGIYVAYLSGRQTTKPRMANFYLILALMLIATGMYIGIYVYNSKG